MAALRIDDGWMDGWMYCVQTDGWTNVWMNGYLDGQTDRHGWMDGGTDRRRDSVDRWTNMRWTNRSIVGKNREMNGSVQGCIDNQIETDIQT